MPALLDTIQRERAGDMLPSLRTVLSYEPATGTFRWVSDVSNRHAGDLAGSINKQGYWQIKVFRKTWLAHRLAWLFTHGEFSKATIDHINGNRVDNRIVNLREASIAENSRNKAPTARAYPKGVEVNGGRFVARICLNGRREYLGSFGCPNEAHAAYRLAARRLHGEFARPQ